MRKCESAEVNMYKMRKIKMRK